MDEEDIYSRGVDNIFHWDAGPSEYEGATAWIVISYHSD